MTTIETPTVRQLVADILAADKHARFAGSVGDARHRAEGHTYHLSYDDQRHDKGYSVSLWGDTHMSADCRKGAAAIDISAHRPKDLPEHEAFRNGLSWEERHLAKLIARFHHMAVTNPKALTAMGVREFAGPDGKGGVFAMSERKHKGRPSTFVQTFGWDNSHRGHSHISLNRRFIYNRRIRRIAQFWRGL